MGTVSSGLVAAIAIVMSAGVQAHRYTIVDLGARRMPEGINSAGMVAGLFDRHGKTKAIERQDDQWHPLDPTATVAYSIDVDGTVGGGSEFMQGLSTPYTWDVDGVRHGIVLPNGAASGMIDGISNGQIAGNYLPSNAVKHRCFVGDARTGETQDIGTLPRGDDCVAYGINASGQVVGASTVGEIDDPYHAFSWRDGTITDLGTLPGGTGSSAAAVNDAGHIVGNSTLPNSAFHHAVLWKDGVITDIGNSPRYFDSEALAVDNKDVAVGRAQRVGLSRTQAVMFEGGRVLPLGQMVTNLGAWQLSEATGINDSGVIVGSGRLDGTLHAFMLLPKNSR